MKRAKSHKDFKWIVEGLLKANFEIAGELEQAQKNLNNVINRGT